MDAATRVARINELARKKRTVGLTEAELAEQARLRAEYLQAFRQGMEEMLGSIVIQEPDGSQHPLERKPDQG